MELNDFILDSGDNWSEKGGILHYKKIVKIPICYIDGGDFLWIFLDNRIKKQVINLIKFAMNRGIKFYLAYPDTANPSGVSRLYERIIYHYLYTNIRGEFREEFKKIGFDIVDNLSKFVYDYKKIDELREVYNELTIEVEREEYDWFSNIKKYKYSDEIRTEWKTIWRNIKINYILS